MGELSPVATTTLLQLPNKNMSWGLPACTSLAAEVQVSYMVQCSPPCMEGEMLVVTKNRLQLERPLQVGLATIVNCGLGTSCLKLYEAPLGPVKEA